MSYPRHMLEDSWQPNDWKLAKYGDEKESHGNAVAIDESKMIESIPFSKKEIEALEKMS